MLRADVADAVVVVVVVVVVVALYSIKQRRTWDVAPSPITLIGIAEIGLRQYGGFLVYNALSVFKACVKARVGVRV